MKPRIDFALYLITDRKQVKGEDLLSAVAAAFRGGVRAVQIREKDLSGRELYELARQVKKLASRFHGRVLINDRVDIALALKLDGVHLPASGFPPEAARKLLGPKPLLGVSTHSAAEAQAAQRAGADFVTFGPVYATASKARYGPPVGIRALREAVSQVTLPVFALGGIGPENVAEVAATGAWGVAMISAILAERAPERAAKHLLGLWKSELRKEHG